MAPTILFILLTLPIMSKSTMMQIFKPCHVGIHWIVLAEFSQMSTHVPGFQSFLRFLHHFVLAKLATTSIRVIDLHVHVFSQYIVTCLSKSMMES